MDSPSATDADGGRLARGLRARQRPLARRRTSVATRFRIGQIAHRSSQFGLNAGLSFTSRFEIQRAPASLFAAAPTVRPPAEFWAFDREADEPAPEQPPPRFERHEPLSAEVATTGSSKYDALIRSMRDKGTEPGSARPDGTARRRPSPRSARPEQVRRGLPSTVNRRGATRAGRSTGPGTGSHRFVPQPVAPAPTEAVRHLFPTSGPSDGGPSTPSARASGGPSADPLRRSPAGPPTTGPEVARAVSRGPAPVQRRAASARAQQTGSTIAGAPRSSPTAPRTPTDLAAAGDAGSDVVRPERSGVSDLAAAGDAGSDVVRPERSGFSDLAAAGDAGSDVVRPEWSGVSDLAAAGDAVAGFAEAGPGAVGVLESPIAPLRLASTLASIGSLISRSVLSAPDDARPIERSWAASIKPGTTHQVIHSRAAETAAGQPDPHLDHDRSSDGHSNRAPIRRSRRQVSNLASPGPESRRATAVPTGRVTPGHAPPEASPVLPLHSRVDDVGAGGHRPRPVADLVRRGGFRRGIQRAARATPSAPGLAGTEPMHGELRRDAAGLSVEWVPVRPTNVPFAGRADTGDPIARLFGGRPESPSSVVDDTSAHADRPTHDGGAARRSTSSALLGSPPSPADTTPRGLPAAPAAGARGLPPSPADTTPRGFPAAPAGPRTPGLPASPAQLGAPAIGSIGPGAISRPHARRVFSARPGRLFAAAETPVPRPGPQPVPGWGSGHVGFTSSRPAAGSVDHRVDSGVDVTVRDPSPIAGVDAGAIRRVARGRHSTSAAIARSTTLSSALRSEVTAVPPRPDGTATAGAPTPISPPLSASTAGSARDSRPSPTSSSAVHGVDGERSFDPSTPTAVPPPVAGRGLAAGATSTTTSTTEPTGARSLGDRFLSALSQRRREAPRPLPTQFRPLARQIVGDRPVKIATDAASREALGAVDKVAVTTGDTMHLARTPDRSRQSVEVLAHELTHVAHTSAVPRFYDDDHDSTEERKAEAIGKVMAATSLPTSARAAVVARTTEPTRVGTSGLAVGAPMQLVSGGASTNARSTPAVVQRSTSSSSGGISAVQMAQNIKEGRPPMSSSSPTSSVQRTTDPAAPPTIQRLEEGPTYTDDSTDEMSLRALFDTASSSDFHDFVDVIVDALEERVIAELDRRGGPFRGGF